MAATPSRVDIRPATAADLAAILAVERSCYAQPWSEAQFRGEFANPHGRIDLLTPSMASWPDYHCWWLLCGELHVLNLATAPRFRRRGVAARLLAAALDEAAGRGLERALLEVRAGNAAAIALYRRFGFRESGRRTRYYPDGEDALLMVREGAGKGGGSFEF